jgi:hypothetical protein
MSPDSSLYRDRDFLFFPLMRSYSFRKEAIRFRASNRCCFCYWSTNRFDPCPENSLNGLMKGGCEIEKNEVGMERDGRNKVGLRLFFIGSLSCYR